MFFDSSYHLFPPMEWEYRIAENVGFTITMFRFVLAFLASIPVSILFRFVPTATGRHAYSVVTGFLLIYFPFGNGCFHAFITSTVVYVFMATAPTRCGNLAWGFAFPYLIGNHINQASGMAWKEGQLDFTGAQMILTLKLVSVAMCYQDGACPDKSRLHPYGLSKMITTCPTILEYFSYLFAAGNLLSGPTFEAKDYFDYINRVGDWDEEHRPECRIPSPWMPGLYRFGKALCCGAVWIYFTGHGINVDLIESEYWRKDLSFAVRCLALWATIVVYRFKYYAVWCISESGMIFSGFGYRMRDEDGRPRWDRYISSHIRQVELNPSLADTPKHWNLCTGLWLRHYVYERLSKPGSKPSFFNMIVTQLVSGVWHGVFAGYWMFFATTAFMFQASRVIYRYETTWLQRWRTFAPWYMFKVVMSALVLSYAGSAFMVLSYSESMLIWRSVAYYGHWWVLALIILSKVLPPAKSSKAKKEE